MPNQPEVTAPVSRGLNASIGVIANYGTSKGAAGGTMGVGGSNGSVGGLRDNGTASFQNAAKNPTAQIKDVYNGANGASVTSSANPLSIQNDSKTAAGNSEYVVRSFVQNPNSPGVNGGFLTNYPKSTQNVESPSKDGYNKNYATTIGGNTLNLKGIETSREFGSVNNDLTRAANNANEAALNSNKKIDGAKMVGDPTVQVRNEATDQGIVSNNFVKNNTANVPNGATELAGKYTGIQP